MPSPDSQPTPHPRNKKINSKSGLESLSRVEDNTFLEVPLAMVVQLLSYYADGVGR